MGSTVTRGKGHPVSRAQARAAAAKLDLAWDDEVDEMWNRIRDDKDKTTSSLLAGAFQDLQTARGGRVPLPVHGETPGVGVAQCPFAVAARKAKSDAPPLKVLGGTHQPSSGAKQLLKSIGGRDRLLAVTARFYPTMFRDQQLSKFVADTTEPHPERLADWIAEKMTGDRRYWSSKLQDRVGDTAYDRSSAHFRAWHSPKREESRFGEHFKLDDSVMWMRLMFWALREEGIDEREPFFHWYLQFIGHFVRVYERSAPAHVAAAAEWSKDPANIAAYAASGYLMTDVLHLR